MRGCKGNLELKVSRESMEGGTRAAIIYGSVNRRSHRRAREKPSPGAALKIRPAYRTCVAPPGVAWRIDGRMRPEVLVNLDRFVNEPSRRLKGRHSFEESRRRSDRFAAGADATGAGVGEKIDGKTTSAFFDSMRSRRSSGSLFHRERHPRVISRDACSNYGTRHRP